MSDPVMTASASHPPHPKERALNMFKIIMGNCFCEPLVPFDLGSASSTQFVELHGILFIGLGAMSDELTPKERVYDTLEQMRSRTERMVSIGYLVEDDDPSAQDLPADADIRKITQTIALDLWNQTYPKDSHMSRPVKKLVDQLKVSIWWACDYHSCFKCGSRNNSVVSLVIVSLISILCVYHFTQSLHSFRMTE